MCRCTNGQISTSYFDQGGTGTAGSHWEKRILNVRLGPSESDPLYVVSPAPHSARVHDRRGGLR